MSNPYHLRSDAAATLLAQIANLIFAAGSVWCTLLVGKQILDFLKYGEWSASPFLHYVGELLYWEWALIPNTWLGIHRILDSLNAGFGILLASAVLASAIGLVSLSVRDHTP